MKKSIGKSIVALVIIAISSMAFAFASRAYESSPVRPYIGIEHGRIHIDSERAPFVGITIGSKLSNRTSAEVFARAEALSAFPEAGMDVSVTDIESAFAFTVGAALTTRMFRDAAFNPFVQVGIGSMAVGHFITEGDDDWVISDLEHTIYSLVATGLEVNIFGGLSIQFAHGYRYIPHREVLDIAPHKLSGSFNSVAFKAYLD